MGIYSLRLCCCCQITHVPFGVYEWVWYMWTVLYILYWNWTLEKKKKNVIGESLSLTQHIVKIHSWWNPRRCTMGAGSKEYGLTTWWGPALICLRCFRKPEDRVRGRRTSPAAYLSQPAFATSSTTLPVARFTWINAVICFSKDTNKFFLYVSECKFYI